MRDDLSKQFFIFNLEFNFKYHYNFIIIILNYSQNFQLLCDGSRSETNIYEGQLSNRP